MNDQIKAENKYPPDNTDCMIILTHIRFSFFVNIENNVIKWVDVIYSHLNNTSFPHIPLVTWKIKRVLHMRKIQGFT